MEIPKFIIGIILFVVIILAGVQLVSDVDTNYSGIGGASGMNSSISGFSKITDRAKNISDDSDSIQGKVFKEAPVSSDDNIIGSIVKGGWEALKITGNSITLSVDLVQIVSDETSSLGINAIYWKMLTAALLVVAIFAIIYLIFSLTGGA